MNQFGVRNAELDRTDEQPHCATPVGLKRGARPAAEAFSRAVFLLTSHKVICPWCLGLVAGSLVFEF